MMNSESLYLLHRRTFTALAMSDELRLDYQLRPGDIGIVNNLTMLHAKTAFRVSEPHTSYNPICDPLRFPVV